MNEHWQDEIQKAFRTTSSLLDYLELAESNAPYNISNPPEFSLLVPQNYASLIKRKDWYDPLLSQVLPRAQEMSVCPGFTDDPVGDNDACVAPGVLHKYPGRVLLLANNECAIHCRFCFRRVCRTQLCETLNEKSWEYLKAHDDIKEVILSGGDPLMLDTLKLMELFERINLLSSVATIRVHTRLPIVLPTRIDQDFLNLITRIMKTKQVVFVIHVNHAQEIGEESVNCISKLKNSGVLLLSQTVLLKGINDSVYALENLFRTLVKHSVVPYYLHQLDKVHGAAHFEVPQLNGIELVRLLQNRLPGYMVPRYVQEIPGDTSKKLVL